MKAGRVILAVLLAATLAGEAPQSLAQYRGSGMPGGGMRGSRGGSADSDRGPRAPGGPAMQEDAVSLTEYRLDLLHMDLKLTPEQEPLWKSFADKAGALAVDIARERGRSQAVLQMKALARIDHAMDVARDRLTALEDVAAAARALYGRLTPEQQSIADARLATAIPAASPGVASAPGPAVAPVTRDRTLPQ